MAIIYTIGYTAFPEIRDFICELEKRGIDLLIDVRSTPYSTHYEQYNSEILCSTLKLHNIIYKHLPQYFGARQKERKYYTYSEEPYLDFELFGSSDIFEEGYEKTIKATEMGYTPVFMCAEKDPIGCHRAILISRQFKEKGQDVRHILADGSEEYHSDLEIRLADQFPEDEPNQFSLFEENLPQSFEERLRKAYRIQNANIGYKWKDIIK